MRKILVCAVLAAVTPASAQVVFDASELSRIQSGAKSLRERLAPAQVDPQPIARLFDRLIKEGERVESEQGIQEMYRRLGSFDARGKMRNLEVCLIEGQDPDAQDAEPAARHSVYRRTFSHLEASNEDYRLTDDGTGRMDAWDWVVSFDGRLLSVTHTVAPMAPDAKGVIAPVAEKTRAYRLSPSDPAVLRRWNRVVKDLLTLGRTVRI